MKNKGMVYVLGGSVLLVWGLIIYRVVVAVSADGDVLPKTASAQVKEAYNDYEAKPDTGKLLLNYRDPFGMVATPVKDTSAAPPVRSELRRTMPVAPKVQFNWGFIKYSGFIRNPDSKKLIAIMSINGKNVMLAEGETDSDVKLLKNLKDSVRVSFKGKTKFITIDHSTL